MKTLPSSNLWKTEYPAHTIDLYRQVARDIQASNSGIERYVIGLFGPDLIGSWALALDPYRQFYNRPRRVSLLTDGPKIVRTRTLESSRRFPRKEQWTRFNLNYTYARNPQAGLFDYYYIGPLRTSSSAVVLRGDQPPLYGVLTDTTRATRPINHIGGEFELFAPKVESPNKNHTFKRQDIIVSNTIGSGQVTRDMSWTQSIITGPEFLCTNASVQTILPAIRARATTAMSSNVMAMLDRVHPRHRNFDLFYQIAELRDIPRTLQGTLQVWLNFERLVGTNFFRDLLRSASNWRNLDLLRAYERRLGQNTGFRVDELASIPENASSAFLSFKFGWESTVRGVTEFLPAPGRVTREINLLIDQIGSDRSRRTKKSWIERETSFPAFSTQLLKDEGVDDFTVRTEGHRKCELRLMANFTIQFPHLDLPRLRRELFARKIGAQPSPSDVYNLIPWTWLVDWFSGAGDYVQLMDSVANDTSLINYGFLTYREEGETTASVRGKFTTQVSRNINGVNNTYFNEEKYLHAGKFKYIYQLRRSIPAITNVKSLWDSNLGPTQQAIIGALISTRTGSAARRDAS